MALNGLFCADVPLRSYSLTYPLTRSRNASATINDQFCRTGKSATSRLSTESDVTETSTWQRWAIIRDGEQTTIPEHVDKYWPRTLYGGLFTRPANNDHLVDYRAPQST